MASAVAGLYLMSFIVFLSMCRCLSMVRTWNIWKPIRESGYTDFNLYGLGAAHVSVAQHKFDVFPVCWNAGADIEFTIVDFLANMSYPRNPRVGFSFHLAQSVVTFTRFAWLPWIVLYMHQRKYNSWTSTVSAYGLLLSCFQIGIYGGQSVTNSKILNSSWFTVAFMVLTGSFIALCFITRITIVLLLFSLMGFSGTILSGVSVDIDSSSPNMSFLKRAKDSEKSNGVERNLTFFMFVIIIAGYLYDARPLAQFPMYSLAVLLAVFCLLLVLYFALLSKVISARSKANNAGKSFAHSSTMVTTSSSIGSVGGSGQLSVGPAPEYSGAVPANFLSACSGNIDKARVMYGKALHWRKQQNLEAIFTTPQPHFHDILRYYPHAIHGYSLDGCAVVYEILGKGDMAGLKRVGATIDQIVWHFALRNELVFERLLEPEFVQRNGGVVAPYTAPTDPNILPRPVRRLMTVLDVGGISFSAVNSDVLAFIKKSGELIDNYYPEQVARLVICNAPSWFSTIWRLISGALPESVQKKIDILYDSKGLDKFIHPSQRPVAYGGTGVELGQAAGHLEFLALEKQWAAQRSASAVETGAASCGNGARVASATAASGAAAAGSASKSSDGDKGKSNSGGVLGWFRRPQAAYLGEELTLRYNSATGTWDDAATWDDADEGGTSGASSGAVAAVGKELNSGGTKGEKKRPAAVTSASTPASRLQEQVAEHGMVLAIHAAHRANARREGGGGENSATGPREGGAGKGISLSSASGVSGLGQLEDGIAVGLRSSSYGEGDGVRGGIELEPSLRRSASVQIEEASNAQPGSSRQLSGAKLSPTLFLLVISGYMLCLGVQSALFTLIPVWLVIPATAGGMEYSVREVSLVLSSAATFALIGHRLLGSRCDHMLKSSPVRALRIGCGLLLVVVFLLPSFMDYTSRTAEVVAMQNPASSFSLYDSTPAADDVIKFVRVFGKELSAHVPISYSTFTSADHHNVAYDYVHWASSKYTFHHRSLLGLQLPAVLLAFMLCGLQLCRRASGVLLHVTLAGSFNGPDSVRRTLNACVDVAGPILAALLYSLIYGMRLKYPLDASNFFAVCGCILLLVYIGSIIVKVQFRGEYGVMPDLKESQSGVMNVVMSESNSDSFAGGSASAAGGVSGGYVRHRRRGLGGSSGAGDGDEEGEDGTGRTSMLERVFAIPLGDASLLWTPVFAAYGSKLYNLKDDFKDL